MGITLSEAQAGLARERVREAGLDDRVSIRVQDYRDLAGERFDAIASIGMAEHVGAQRIDLYARHLAGMLRPGGRLLNHAIARLYEASAGVFTLRYVFPDSEPLPLSRVLLALERAGFVTEHVEGFRGHYVETLRHWARRLDEHREDAVRLVGEERVRVWRLYLRTHARTSSRASSRSTRSSATSERTESTAPCNQEDAPRPPHRAAVFAACRGSPPAPRSQRYLRQSSHATRPPTGYPSHGRRHGKANRRTMRGVRDRDRARPGGTDDR